MLDGYFETKTLEVDDSTEYHSGSKEVHDVRETVAPEGLAEGATLIIPGEKKVEEGYDGTFELRTTTGVDEGGENAFQMMFSQIVIAIETVSNLCHCKIKDHARF